MLVIGDVHGKIDQYLSIRGSSSVQVGDMGFDYSKISHDLNHRWVMGNHESWNKTHPCMLRDFGIEQLGLTRFFYMAGAYSIDKQWRTPGFDWFQEEEMPYQRLQECIDYFCTHKPEIVISHTCPISVVVSLHGDSRHSTQTEKAMEVMWECHKPKYWIFGHHHKSFVDHREGTLFRCLNELEVVEV